MSLVVTALAVLSIWVGAGLDALAPTTARAVASAPATRTPGSAPRGGSWRRRVALTVAGLRLMNYYPSAHPWNGMWTDWDPAGFDADMARAAALGANTVRIIVHPSTFGYPVPDVDYISRLDEALTLAAAHRLRVELTLFDGFATYGDLDGSRAWAAALLAPFRADPRIAFVEVQNEMQPADPLAMAWARALIPAVRADVRRPVTVSVAGYDSATPLAQLTARLGRSYPDLLDFHFYGHPSTMVSTFTAARRIAHRAPLLIGETGYSTDPSNASIGGIAPTVAAHEREQATFFLDAEIAAHVARLPPAAPWTLIDFSAPPTLDAVQRHFGLLRADGTAKPAAKVILDAFTRWR